MARVYRLPRETVPTARIPDQTGKEKGQLRLTFSSAWRESMRKGPFLSKQSPQPNGLHKTKAEFDNRLLHFINSGFEQMLFTKKLNSRLSNTFGHIAHYNEGACGGVVRRSLRSGSVSSNTCSPALLWRSVVYLQ